MVSAPRSGERKNGRASIVPSRSSGLPSRPNPVRTTPGCAQLAVTPVPSSLRASSRVNRMFASLLLAYERQLQRVPVPWVPRNGPGRAVPDLCQLDLGLSGLGAPYPIRTAAWPPGSVVRLKVGWYLVRCDLMNDRIQLLYVDEVRCAGGSVVANTIDLSKLAGPPPGDWLPKSTIRSGWKWTIIAMSSGSRGSMLPLRS